MKPLQKKIKILISEGYPPKQAVAIAHQMLKSRSGLVSEKKISAWKRQQKRRKGVVVNERMSEPTPYCPPVDSEMCAICGEYYAAVVLNAGGMQEASDRIRSLAGGYKKGGGYRSRGPLLWAMHVMKMESWYERHFPHCELGMIYESDNLPVPFPPSVIWAESFGKGRLSSLADQWMNLYNLEIQKDYEGSLIVRPIDYTKQMKRLLVSIQEGVNKLEPKRKRLELPTRQQQFEEWKKENFVSISSTDIPF